MMISIPPMSIGLGLFTVVQTKRTEKAVMEIAALMSDVTEESFKGYPKQRPELSHLQLLALCMRGGLATHEFSLDLKFIVLRNRTAIDFIISDNPAMITNKLAFERWEDKSFGMVNSGVILVLPLTPRLLAFYFDIGIYTVSIPRGTCFVDVTRPSDVKALNHLQCLNANKNLYFSNWEERFEVGKQGRDTADVRAKVRHAITTLIRDPHVRGRAQAFRKGSEEEKAKSSSRLIIGSAVHPEPAFWPSFLNYRPKPTMFSNNSAIGYVRKKEWLRAWLG
jgi:hypothetical protein